MASYEKIKNLSKVEKLKLLGILIESLKPDSDPSDVSVKNTQSSLNVDTLLGDLIDGHNVSSEGNSRKKQQTLDSWLTKPKDVSLHKSTAGDSPCLSEELNDLRLNSNVNKVAECSNQPRLNHIDDVSSLNSSKSKKKSSKTAKHKSSKVINCHEKKVHSPSNTVESASTVTKKYNLRTKRKSNEPSQLSEHIKCSVYIEDIGLDKFTREIVQSQTTNNCEINHDISTGNIIVSNHNSNPAKKVDCLNPSDKTPKNKKSRKSSLNLRNSVESVSKPSNNVIKCNNLDVNDETASSKNEEYTTDSSLLSNYEAFHILEVECSRIGLNILDILQDENIQNVLNNTKKFSDEGIVLVDSLISNNDSLPVVHLIKSRKRLCENLNELQNTK